MLLSENPIGERSRNWGNAYVDAEIKNCIYIPEKDILEHAKGLLPFIEQKTTGFSSIYKDLLIAAQDIPTQEQSVMQKSVGEKISLAICGHVEWVHGEGTFYMIKNDGKRIPFSDEASGFKKLGFLGLLITSGQLEPNTVLFWDEPENSLNPELIPILVDILLELSRNGVQIFISTHSEILASYFAVNRQAGDSVMFTALYKDGEQIKATTSDRFDLLEPNNLTAEQIKLYEKEIVKGLNGNG
jgi:predicted ATPase